MDNPRPEKVAVVDEVRGKLQGADAVLLTEYRGLTVSDLAALRDAMRNAGGEYKVYKNTLVRLAAKELGIDIDDVLVGPTALAFVAQKPDGSPGDIATVAKAISDFAKSQPLLVLKGGLLGETVLDVAGAKALASLPTADEVYARLAGAVNGNARGLAGMISGVHRSLGYVLQAAIDAGAFAGDAPAPSTETTESTESAEASVPSDDDTPAADAPEASAPEQEAPADDAPAEESEN